ncbi:hypothetical protein [Entomohabitans teleogrylli]|uniref:hypothetical protein n=1 Tax=Entomohabitans teleogrylli TaxID=1384589 RepID=UPI00073D6CAE|nr:hypothetical protein [Entomohabitans teleogrylli]
MRQLSQSEMECVNGAGNIQHIFAIFATKLANMAGVPPERTSQQDMVDGFLNIGKQVEKFLLSLPLIGSFLSIINKDD